MTFSSATKSELTHSLYRLWFRDNWPTTIGLHTFGIATFGLLPHLGVWDSHNPTSVSSNHYFH